MELKKFEFGFNEQLVLVFACIFESEGFKKSKDEDDVEARPGDITGYLKTNPFHNEKARELFKNDTESSENRKKWIITLYVWEEEFSQKFQRLEKGLRETGTIFSLKSTRWSRVCNSCYNFCWIFVCLLCILLVILAFISTFILGPILGDILTFLK
eukprot:GHVP01035330.1.p1 GENE.GHVP01035330.1~~GHVP01035330.1.p1  ORF type:complete len:156 (+),score=22.05 GHVP01035330.1:612-1079(+)